MSSEEQKTSPSRKRPTTDEFRAFVATGWAPRSTAVTPRSEAADWAAQRREAISAAFPGERLVVPAGGLKVRSNDTDYVFRPHSAFAHLTGLGSDREPDAVLVLEPRRGDDGGSAGHDAVIYFRPLADRDTEEFFGDSRYGEFWVGARPTLADVESELGVAARHIDEFGDAVAKDADALRVRVVRDADPEVAALVDRARQAAAAAPDAQQADALAEQAREADDELSAALSLLRMVKDEWEIEQMRSAVEGTHRGFDAVIADLPEAVRRGRGERWVEGVFGLHARHHGNGVGYDSICASGDHANTLHWIKNTGDITRRRPAPARRRRRGRLALHRRHHPHPAGERHLHRRPARDLRRRLCRPGGGHRRLQARQPVQRRPRRRDPRHRRAPARLGSAARGHRRRGARSTPTTGSTTAAGWCTARATTSASTCTTARSRRESSTTTPCSSPA